MSVMLSLVHPELVEGSKHPLTTRHSLFLIFKEQNMKKKIYKAFISLLLLFSAVQWAMAQGPALAYSKTTAPALSDWQAPKPAAPDAAQYSKLLGSAALLFTENAGQVADGKGRTRPDVLFTAHNDGTAIYLTATGISYQFTKTDYPKGYEKDSKKVKDQFLQDALQKKIKTGSYRMDIALVGANRHPTVRREAQGDYTENFYLPQCPSGIVAHTCGRVVYQDVYPGIDWVVYSSGKKLEYDFVVRPGADPARIKLRITGARPSISADGLTMTTPLGEVREKMPVATCGGQAVASSFVLRGSDIGFSTGGYNKSQILTIDPTVTWATYYGGSGFEGIINGQAFLALDAGGNVYMSGSTTTGTSTAIAPSSGVYQSTFGGGQDAFLVKFSPAGARLWATYYGGSGTEGNGGCAVDNSTGNVYLSGYTSSTTGIASGGFQNTFGGGSGDQFLVQFNSAGVRQWATYYGGSGNDERGNCAVDGSGNVYLCGSTTSTTGIASGGSQNAYGGGNFDCFLVKFNSAGTRQWGTYYGGSGDDGQVMVGTTSYVPLSYCAVDASNNVYLTGITSSTSGIASSGFQNAYGGGNFDCFLVQFNSAGTRQWGTYYGGSGDDLDGTLATDPNSGNIYLGGYYTTSTTGIATAGAYQTANAGGSNGNGFLIQFNSAGVRQWGTYYGGSSGDYIVGCAVDGVGNVYFSGLAQSSTGIASGGFQNTLAGTSDAFLVKFRSTGTRQWGSYFGGNSDEGGQAVAVADNCTVYLAGYTASTSGIATTGAFQTGNGGNYDAFLAKISTGPNTAPVLAASNLAIATSNIACPNGSAYLEFVDPGTPANKYLAINPNGNAGYNFATTTPVAANNSPAINHQMKTDGANNTTALSNRVYTIQDAGTNNYPSGMTVRLYYAPADTTAAVTALDGAVTHSSTSKWFKFEGTSNTANVAAILAAQTTTGITGATYLTPSATGTEGGVNYVEFSGITHFSTFGYLAAKTGFTLPVTLTSFTGTSNGCTAALAWQSATEENNSYYEVQASTNGTGFTAAGKVASKNSATGASYSYQYNGLKIGNNFFRLKMVDLDGKFTYSPTVAVTGTGDCAARRFRCPQTPSHR